MNDKHIETYAADIERGVKIHLPPDLNTAESWRVWYRLREIDAINRDLLRYVLQQCCEARAEGYAAAKLEGALQPKDVAAEREHCERAVDRVWGRWNTGEDEPNHEDWLLHTQRAHARAEAEAKLANLRAAGKRLYERYAPATCDVSAWTMFAAELESNE